MKGLVKTKFRKLIGWIILALFLIVTVFADFLAPYDYRQQSRNEPSAPASGLHFARADGSVSLRPSVYRTRLTDPLRLTYVEDQSQSYPIEFFVSGYPYKLFGVVPTDLHLFGIVEPNSPKVNLLGTDMLGRDRFSRLMEAVSFSLIVCSIGVILASIVGTLIGIVSGYSSRFVDTVLMGATDAMLALPTLILILAARAAFPLELPPWRAALLLLLIFALTGWAEMARLTRGLVLATRERDFVTAAIATGVTEMRVLFRHILPNVARPLVIQALLMLPAFLLAEVTLSYFGVGVQEPEASLGNILTSASDLNLLRSQPVSTLSPAIVIFLFVLGVHLLSGRTNTAPAVIATAARAESEPA